MSYEQIFSTIIDKLFCEINKPYVKEKFQKIATPVFDSMIKKCQPFILLLFLLYMLLLILLIIIIVFLISKKK